MESTDIKLICRLCAKEDKFCIDIFGEDGVKNNISKKIRLCLPIAVKEDDEFPKQICLSCLNKLDTSYELYSGCMNAQNTIKRLLKIFARPKPPGSDICVISEVQNDTNVMVQQLPALSLSKPLMKFGKTIVQLQNTSSTKENDRHTPESVPKVRRLQSERHDNLTLELDSDDSNSVGSTLWSLPLDDDDDDDDDGDGGSTQATQQVSRLGLPTETLSACTVAPSDKMYVDGTVGTVPSSQQVSKASSNDQVVGSIPTSIKVQLLETVQTVSSVGTKIESSSSASGLVMTSSELSGTSSQYVNYSSSMDSALPAMAQQPRQNTLRQLNVYIPDSVCSSLTGKQGGSTTGSLSLFEEKLEQSKQLCSQKDAPQHQSSQQGEAKQNQQTISLKNQKPAVLAFAGIKRAKYNETAKYNENHKRAGFRAILPSLPQQQELVSVNASSSSKGNISPKPVSLIQLPIVEANQRGAVPPVMQTESQRIYVSNPIQNNTPIVSNQQTEDFESQHLDSSGHHVQAKGFSSEATVTTITNSVTPTISNRRAGTGGVSLGAPPTLAMVTPTGTTLMGTGMCAPSAADTTSVLNMGVPTVNRIGIIAPVSNCTLDMLTPTAPSSTFSTVTPVATSSNSTAAPGSDSAINTEIPCKFDTVNEQISESMLTVEESSDITDVKPHNSMSEVTTHSTATPHTIVATIKTDNSVGENTINVCEYCNKSFPDDIIVHHRKLHFRQRFFSCIVCGKNFRTEVGLENHRCGNSAE